MKITYNDFKQSILEKINAVGKGAYKMLKDDTMYIWLSDSGDGLLNSRYEQLECKFTELYAIYEKAIELGGTMYLGASAARSGKKIGSSDFPLDTIDAFVAINYYGNEVGDKITRRSTYYAAILDWAGFVDNHWGGYITVKSRYM